MRRGTTKPHMRELLILSVCACIADSGRDGAKQQAALSVDTHHESSKQEQRHTSLHADVGNISEHIPQETLTSDSVEDFASAPTVVPEDKVEEPDLCGSGGSWFPLGRGTPSESLTARELVWNFLHRELMPKDVAYRLLDLETIRDGQRFRNASGEWIESIANSCTDSTICHGIATQITLTSDNDCPTATLLSKTQAALEKVWANRLVSKGSRAPEMSLPEEDLTSGQLAVKLWGLSLLEQDEKRGNCGGSIAGPAKQAEPSAVLQPEASDGTVMIDTTDVETIDATETGNASMTAQTRLDILVSSLAETNNGDLLHYVRDFLRMAEKQRGFRPVGPTGYSDSLLPLLRLLHEQRNQATIESLARDAVLVGFYEGRVKQLEWGWAKLFGDCAPQDDNVQKHGNEEIHINAAGALAQTQGKSMRSAKELKMGVDSLIAGLERLAKDHATALPADIGALPAYWTGRLERVRRHVEDRMAGREGSRPTVLVWTCSFGGGHWAATRALEGYLPDYNTVVTDPTRDQEYYEGDNIGNWIRRFIQPNWDETYLFNDLVLQNHDYGLYGIGESLQSFRGWLRGDGTRWARPCPAPTCDYQNKKLMRRALLRTAPDIVVTVYHMDLLPISELCDELGGLPLMHLSTDADAKMWEVFGTTPKYPNLHVGLPFDVPEAWPTAKPVDKDQTFVSGYSVRMAFLRPLPTDAERTAERARRGIAPGTQVALVMSGSQGQSVPWPARLADSETWDQSLHVIVVAAANKEFGRSLEGSLLSGKRIGRHRRLHGKNTNVTVEVARDPEAGSLGQNAYYLSEDEVASLMDTADVLITKAGGSTITEAAYRGLPTIFDATPGMLPWEEFNAKVFEKYGRGRRIADVDNIEEDMQYAITLGRNRTLILDRYGQPIDSRQHIRREMSQMLSDATWRRQAPQDADSLDEKMSES